MAQSINRREFMTASAGIAAGLSVGAASMGAQTPAAGRGGGDAPVSSLTFKTKPHKALIARPTEDDLQRMKDAGLLNPADPDGRGTSVNIREAFGGRCYGRPSKP